MPANRIDGGTTYKLAGCLNDLIGAEAATRLLLQIMELVSDHPDRLDELRRAVQVVRDSAERDQRGLRVVRTEQPAEEGDDDGG